MRSTSKWSQKLRQFLFKANDLSSYVSNLVSATDEQWQKREKMRLAHLITEVELGLVLLRKIAPDEVAISVDPLLSGYRFPVPFLQDNDQWLLVQRARFYLVRRKGRQWERSLLEYINIPISLRIFSLTNSNEVAQLIPTTICPQRLSSFYLPTLEATPPHEMRRINLATSGFWYAKISDNNSLVEVPINIPESIKHLSQSSSVTLRKTRTANNPPLVVTYEQLLRDAQAMDEQLKLLGYEPENYQQRLRGIALQVFDSSTNNFQPNQVINLEKFISIVGLLNVGKSTLIQVLMYHLAQQGYRCGLIVSDVVEQVRLASLFSHKLGIPAAPILGMNDRAGQLTKVYEPILATMGSEIERGAIHPAWRWFSPICPLLALVKAPEKWDFGEEPCHQLYQKSGPKNGDNNDEIDSDEDEMIRDKYTCPFYYQCPHHQLEKDIAESLIWILSPASLIHTRVPPQVYQEKITFAEAVYRDCNCLFIDEADRVQVQLDESFAPDEILVDNGGNSLLNHLGLKFAEAIYKSDRRLMDSELISAAKNASDYAQIATDMILPKLHNTPELVAWLGPQPFTGRSLFSQIIRDLLNSESTELEAENQASKPQKLSRKQLKQPSIQPIQSGADNLRERRKKLMQSFEGFLQSPLNRNANNNLIDLAVTVITTDRKKVVLEEVGKWLKKWLDDRGITLSDEDVMKQSVDHLHLAILVTILNERLGFIVDQLSALLRTKVIDLHHTSLSLVYRPPRDYLPIMPSAPVGNILGFQYTPDRQHKQGGKLSYFRYVGVGRYLMLNFPNLWEVDGIDGPHTIVISGTSYAPGSPAYHIQHRPTILLEPAFNNQAGDAGIGESEFYFTPQQNAEGQYIALSGLPPAWRKKAADDMVKAICYPTGKAQNFLDELFSNLQDLATANPQKWKDRQRLLLITSSYDEAEWIESKLQYSYRTENIDAIKVLRRDSAPSNLVGMRRGEIKNLKDFPTKIVVAPLMALERGHNILNDDQIAAFGGAIFLNRPMPVPDDWQTTVQQLNNWALLNYTNSDLYEPIQQRGDALNLANISKEFYQYALAKTRELNCRAMSFKQLNEDERSVLCWTQLVSIWQIIGRLVRGGVPCIVHFMDVKFAPKSATGEIDRTTSSLLVGIIKELKIETAANQDPWKITLAQSLYGAFLNSLKNTKELHYDI